LLTCGADRPQLKVLVKGRANKKDSVPSNSDGGKGLESQPISLRCPSWADAAEILVWSTVWWFCILGLCYLALGGLAHLLEMLSE
jgi:hypothetical protein